MFCWTPVKQTLDFHPFALAILARHVSAGARRYAIQHAHLA